MASKTTLNAKNLEALGVERLAELLIEISTGNANHKRRLRMELVGNASGVELAREVRKRLGSIARAKSWIDWQKVKSVKADLEAQRKTIAEKIAIFDPDEAFELIWQFLSLADPIFERSNDGSGTLIESFHAACDDAGRIAALAKTSTQRVVDKIVAALQDNGYGQYDRLIDAMAPVLGETGLRKLQNAFERWAREPKSKVTEAGMQIVGWSMSGPIYREELHARGQSITVKVALEQIADALGDVDLYIAQQSEASKAFATVATEIAKRLLSAGRAQEALYALDTVEFDNRRDISSQWQVVRAETLEAVGRSQEAQQFRWNIVKAKTSDHRHQWFEAFVIMLGQILVVLFDDRDGVFRVFRLLQVSPVICRKGI
jgi:hypothetical protein